MSPPHLNPFAALVATAAALTPNLAAAADPRLLTPVLVFQHAPPLIKLVMLALVCAAIAAVVICIRKLRPGGRLAGGSPFVAGLRLGGPVFGGFGAAYTGLNSTLGLANHVTAPPMHVLARGWAEIMLLLGIGLLAGAIAVIANWLIEARIDRAILSPS